MSIKLCKSWVENKNARCEKRAMWGTNYCWWHYPKKALILEFFLTMLLTLILNEPLTCIISKVPFLYHVDKNKPNIERISPEVDKISQIEKINHFEVFFTDKYSGINLRKSTLGVLYKTNGEYHHIQGRLNKYDFMLSFIPDKELKYGEYLLDALLCDKANNKNILSIPFIVRPKDELSIFVTSDDFENSPYKNMFNEFIENKKSLIEVNPIDCILQITIRNKLDNIACLKDLYFTIDISGGFFFAWEELGRIEAGEIEMSNFSEAFDKRVQKGKIYLSQELIHIDKIAPGGLVRFIVLIGKPPSLMLRESNIWEGLELWGTYLSDGYGHPETKKIMFRIPKIEFNSSKPE